MIGRIFDRKLKQKTTIDPLQIGARSPDFSLPSTSGKTVSLGNLLGRPLVMVFYPADNSSVCSSQLALYNEALSLFQEHDAQIVGISVDDINAHMEFSKLLRLRFPLLSDSDPIGEVSRAFGVYNSKDSISERVLYVLDSEGIVRWRHISPRAINPGADGILSALESLESGSI